MRIDIDEQLEKQLNEIKKQKWISGRGHTETVRYLANRFKEYESIAVLLERKLAKIDVLLEKGILAAFKKIISNLLQ